MRELGPFQTAVRDRYVELSPNRRADLKGYRQLCRSSGLPARTNLSGSHACHGRSQPRLHPHGLGRRLRLPTRGEHQSRSASQRRSCAQWSLPPQEVLSRLTFALRCHAHLGLRQVLEERSASDSFAAFVHPPGELRRSTVGVGRTTRAQLKSLVGAGIPGMCALPRLPGRSTVRVLLPVTR